MAAVLRAATAAVLVSLLDASAGQAAWCVYYYPAYPAWCGYATPTPAPASRKAPRVIEERTPPAGRPADGKPAAATGERVSVGFWNVAGRDVVLKVDGTSYPVPRNRRVKLDLPRRFVWQVVGAEPQAEQVPEGKATLDLVIRR